MYGMNGNYNIDGYDNNRLRATLSVRGEYQYNNYNLYGEAVKFVEDNGGYEFNAGVNYDF